MWEDREALKPRNQRRPVPQAPTAQTTGSSWNDINKQHAAAMSAFEEQAMCQCPNCGRTFLEDRLQVHLRSCKSDSPAKPPPGKLSSTTKPAPGRNEPAPRGEPKGSRPEANPASTIKPVAKTLGSTGPVRTRNSVEELPIGPRRGGAPQIPHDNDTDIDRVPCRSCGRKFAPDRVDKHQRVCKGPDRPASKPQPQVRAKPKAKGDPLWKRQHMDFINSIRYARKVTSAQKQGIDVRTLAPPPQQFADPTADYVQCPFCDRKYAPQTAERHIPKCKDIVNKPKAPPRALAPRAAQPQRQPPQQTQPQRQAPPQAVQTQPKQSMRASQQQAAKPSPQPQPQVGVRLKPGVREEAKQARKAPARQSCCKSCGEDMGGSARFCSYCGTRV
mmetsp:Transcript_33866/g.58998  ORF Transcript_33866/g.58998 Transcript_33866/m.58998 type:complete len:387 (-) Transcript_33866:2922-4082(-)